jgi:putative ABC transport system substrate-binding protein
MELRASNADELGTALRGVRRGAADAFMVSSEGLFLAHKGKIAEAVAKAKLPAIFPWRDYHDAGVLMSYGASPKEMGRQVAVYVDKILKGAKPADLPIEQMSKYDLVIDLRAARRMGIRVPQDLLLRADEVIK